VRILVTGCTGQQCGRGTLIKYEAVSTVFARGLRLAGAEVDHAAFSAIKSPGEYDAILLGLVPFYSVAGHFVNSALFCLSYALDHGIPLVVYVDDWRFYQLFSNLKSIGKNPQQLVKPFFKGRDMHAEAVEDLDNLAALVDMLHTKPWPVTLVPAFSWGDHARLKAQLLNSPDVVFADISALAEEHPAPEPPVKRERGWVLGTVSNQLEWLDGLNLTWPVHHFGGKASRATAKLSEAELVRKYFENAGVLSPPYEKILGTGWWRNRFVHAARSRAILLCDPGEAPELGPAYDLSAEAVERMTALDLAALSAEQRDIFFSRQLPADAAADAIMSAVHLARERVR
jgi:hypothetical protein